MGFWKIETRITSVEEQHRLLESGLAKTRRRQELLEHELGKLVDWTAKFEAQAGETAKCPSCSMASSAHCNCTIAECPGQDVPERNAFRPALARCLKPDESGASSTASLLSTRATGSQVSVAS